jgi:hypothetical protein
MSAGAGSVDDDAGAAHDIGFARPTALRAAQFWSTP